MSNKELIKYLKNSISEKGNYCYSLPIETTKATIKHIKEKDKEIERLNNIINEFEDFITNVDSHINLGDESEEFILVRDKWLELQELKGSDKE